MHMCLSMCKYLGESEAVMEYLTDDERQVVKRAEMFAKGDECPAATMAADDCLLLAQRLDEARVMSDVLEAKITALRELACDNASYGDRPRDDMDGEDRAAWLERHDVADEIADDMLKIIDGKP